MQHLCELTKENWHEDLISNLAGSLKPEVYVELGLYHCELFNKIVPYADKLYGVDINPDAGQWMTQSEKTFFFHGTTDEFASEIKSRNIKIDLLFIDADHSKESVLKDFWNYFPYVKDHGIILLHDTYPKSLEYTDKGYCGNAFLVVDELKQHQDKFEFMTIPVHPGLTLIRKRNKQVKWMEEQTKPTASEELIMLENKRYKIVVIAQIYNEMRKGNLERFWKYIQPVCDGLVVYDDGSTDGSYEYMLDKAIFTIRAGDNDFENELSHKKILLEYALKLQPDFILRMDADELLTSNPVNEAGAQIELQSICKYADENNIDAISLHEINLWRSHSWKRIDNSYDLGWFVRLWRVTPGLMYNETNRGLHQQDYPQSITTIKKTDSLGVIHYGFDSDLSLAFKYFVYRSHGQTGWALERLLDEKTLSLEKVDEKLFPPGLYIDDDKPTRRSFSEALASLEDYKQVVFKPRISIVCLIYKSTDWLEFVYQQVLKYTDLRDKEFYFVANDANEEVLRYLDQNYIPYHVWNNSPRQRTEWYINNVYRAWNYAAGMAKGDYLLFINSDMGFSENWVENLFNKLNGSNCVASRLVESGKLLSGDHAISKNFGRSVNDYDETAFQEYVKSISEDELITGGLFMPLLIRKDHFMKIGGYPEGNIVPGTDVFRPEISKQGLACVSGDVVLMQKLKSIGVNHTTSYDSVVYHFQCGEMDATESNDHKHDEVRIIISNDYLLGRMGEKTMWGFLLSNLPNAVGVDMDILNVTQNFEKEAGKHIKENYPETAVVIQNASFIGLIDKDHFTILYLQDNLRAMGRKSFQQEANLKHAELLVTNSKLTAASYPEYNFEIIPIGVDDNLFRPLDKEVVRSEFNIPNLKVGIFVGDLSEVKGWEKVKKVIDNHDEIFWIIVSKDSKQYEKSNCKTFNRINQEKLAKLLNCADFYILGSPVETQCLAAIEACFCNLPLIMRNTGIFADFIEEERARIGYFGEDFEKGLSEVLANEYFPREMMFTKKLTIDGMVEKWKALISRARFFAEQKTLKPAIERPPFFSVIVPTYNQDQYLGAALDSLLAQTFQNWEAIIVNDGSTDNTNEVIEKYLLIDKRFRSFHKENGGVSTALNVGIQNAKGQWICWLSSDDWFEHDKLEIHYNAIVEKPEIKFFRSHWSLFFEETKKKLETGVWLPEPHVEFQVTSYFITNYNHGNSIAIHKSVFDDIGLFNETMRQGQDFDMWIRISSKFRSAFINKRTCITRIHKGQTTNTFFEGGVFDSTRALIEFLNNNSFEALFPFYDLTNPNNAKNVVDEILSITVKYDSFLYKCGYTTALIDNMRDWMFRTLTNKLRQQYFELLEKKAQEYLELPLDENMKKVIRKTYSREKCKYKKYDFVQGIIEYIKQLMAVGNQKYAKALEIYLLKISPYYNSQSSIEYSPILSGFPKNGKFSPLNPKQIISWHVNPNPMSFNRIVHKMIIKCNHCNSKINVSFDYQFLPSSYHEDFICPECKTGFHFSDKNFEKDFLEFYKLKVNTQAAKKQSNPRVGFLLRDTATVGGGNKIVFKYMEWLDKLGCKIEIYSYNPKPDWIEINYDYHRITENSSINHNDIDLLIVFSIFDLPKVLNEVPINKVAHLCQGYEGYHYGSDYPSVRADKHILTKLHEIPVRNIVVSQHLVDLFYEKFNRRAEYIPNGVDHRIFTFTKGNSNRENSVLFVGNTFHSLKGFIFLTSALKAIQNSVERIDNLKLYVVYGRKIHDIQKVKEEFKKITGCEVELKFKLSSEEMALLMQKVCLVACTSWYEGFSLPLIEAMGVGTPVITTDNMGAESFCTNNYNSFIVKYGDLHTLTNRILEIIKNKNTVARVINNARKTSQQYSEYNSVKSLIKSFQNLLKNKFDGGKVDELLLEYKTPQLENLFRAIDSQGSVRASVIIPVYNQLEYTKECLESLSRSLNEKIKLIVINNASTDGTKQYLESLSNERFDICIINNQTNLGFPKAVNQGLIETNGEYIVIANNDIVFTPGWLERMLDVAESSVEFGIVGGPISNQVSGVQIDKEAKYSTIDEMYKYAENVITKNSGKNFVFPRLAFLCTLIKRDVLEKIGGLDERFSPGNYEYDDFCLRAQLAGYKTVVVTDVFIHHFGSKSFKANGNQQYLQRLETNKQKFVEKWNATPDELWLQNKPIKTRNYYYPINSDQFMQYLERARIQISEQEYSIALESTEEAIAYYPKENTNGTEIEYHVLLDLAGNIALLTGDYDTAKKYFEEELNLVPDSSSACVGLGEVFYGQEQYENAKIMYEWALKNDPKNNTVLNSLSKVNTLLGIEEYHNSLS